MLGFSTFSQTPLSQSTTEVNANSFLPGVSAQFNVASLDYEAKAFRTISSVSATGNVDIQFDAQGSTFISDVDATTGINSVSSFGIASIALPSTTASFSINTFTDVDAKASIVFDSINTATNLGILEFRADAISPITGVSLTLNNFNFTDEDAQAKITLSSISASLSVNLEDPTFVVFPYADYADQYNTQRTLFIDKQYTNNTVYITA